MLYFTRVVHFGPLITLTILLGCRYLLGNNNKKKRKNKVFLTCSTRIFVYISRVNEANGDIILYLHTNNEKRDYRNNGLLTEALTCFINTKIDKLYRVLSPTSKTSTPPLPLSVSVAAWRHRFQPKLPISAVYARTPDTWH